MGIRNNICSFSLVTLFLLLSGLGLSSCDPGSESYTEQKKRERETISTFLNRDVYVVSHGDTLAHIGKIKVISEDVFGIQEKQCQTPEDEDLMDAVRLADNEYVFFRTSGVYMQILRRGPRNGSVIKKGDHKRLACRLWEYNIMGDSIQMNNWDVSYAKNPEYLDISDDYGIISASLDVNVSTGSHLYNIYGETSIPSGWLIPLEYLRFGAPEEDSGAARVRIIVPHSQGHTHASQYVYPCLYEMVLQSVE